MTKTINGKDYEIRLTAKGCIALEKKLETNPVNTLMRFAENNEVPSMTTLLTIVQAGLPKNEHAEDLYDDMVEDGEGFDELMNLVVDLFKDAGLIPEDVDKDDEERKN